MRALTTVLAVFSIVCLLPPFGRSLKAVTATQLCHFSIAAKHLQICQPKDVSPIKLKTYIGTQVNFTDVASLIVDYQNTLSELEFASNDTEVVVTQIAR